MVATAHILNVNLADRSSVIGLTRYYTGGARYYTHSGERPGVWFGKGAAALKLEGDVIETHLRNLLLGKSKNGRKQLVKVRMLQPDEAKSQVESTEDQNSTTSKKKQNELHVPGYDVT